MGTFALDILPRLDPDIQQWAPWNFTENLLELLILNTPSFSVHSLVARNTPWLLIGCLSFAFTEYQIKLKQIYRLPIYSQYKNSHLSLINVGFKDWLVENSWD